MIGATTVRYLCTLSYCGTCGTYSTSHIRYSVRYGSVQYCTTRLPAQIQRPEEAMLPRIAMYIASHRAIASWRQRVAIAISLSYRYRAIAI